MSKNLPALPKSVSENLKAIKEMGVGAIALMINQRAGRVQSEQVNAAKIINQFNLIESELIEGKKAAYLGDLTQVRDAIADIMLLAAGQQAHIAQLDVDADYRLMCAYNMTRIPKTMEVAIATVNKYDELGIKTYIEEITVNGEVLFPVKTAGVEQYDYNGDHYAANKFLKSVNFHDAAYAPLEGVDIVGEDLEVDHLIGNLFTPEHAEAVMWALTQTDTGAVDLAPQMMSAVKNLIGLRF